MMIPESLPKYDSFELDSIYKPHFTVGGDYFDYFPFEPDCFAFCIADISGKGVAAALLMANFQAVLRSKINKSIPLSTLVRELNEAVYRITKSDKFITLFIARVDIKAGTLEYINAGHCIPYLYTKEAVVNLDQGTTVLGALEELPFVDEEKIMLNDESLILMHTDGLTELTNEANELFDEDHIRAFIFTYNHLSAGQFNKTLLKRLEHFKGGHSFTDDIAVLTCKMYFNQG
jgi:sigma-B regulation protein RsbU (phosphoserine phosphatase)